VIFKSRNENVIYVLIAVFIVLLIFTTVILSSNDIYEAYVDDIILGKNWYEDVNGRYSDNRYLGLEKQISFIYRYEDSEYPSFLTVNTFKTLFMMNEDDLIDKTIETIQDAIKGKNMNIDEDSFIQGERVLKNGHKTIFVIYNGTKILDNQADKVHIIGETWSCRESGTSIVVIGFAQTTNTSNGKTDENLEHWAKIVKDQANTFGFSYYNISDYIFIGEEGLIFNVKCH